LRWADPNEFCPVWLLPKPIFYQFPADEWGLVIVRHHGRP
jgi:hypothetical protein